MSHRSYRGVGVLVLALALSPMQGMGGQQPTRSDWTVNFGFGRIGIVKFEGDQLLCGRCIFVCCGPFGGASFQGSSIRFHPEPVTPYAEVITIFLPVAGVAWLFFQRWRRRFFARTLNKVPLHAV